MRNAGGRKKIRFFNSCFPAFLIAFIFFFLTSAPGIGTEDSAELTGGARFLAMVHAPGYPIYLILGRLASWLSAVPGRGLALLSVFAGAAAVGLLHAILAPRIGTAAAGAAAILLTFCEMFWRASTEVEVYALQSFFIIGVIGALLRLRDDPSERSRNLLGFVIGLTLAHHMGLIILLPFIAAYALHADRSAVTAVTALRWIRSAGFFLIGLSPYLLLLVLSRRAELTTIEWRPIMTFPELFNIMSGAGFKRLLFAVPLNRAMENIVTFPFVLLLQFSLLGIVLATGGLYALMRDRPSFCALLIAMTGMTIFHAANYDVLDPHTFMMPAVPLVAILAGYGFRFLSSFMKLSSRAEIAALGIIFLTAAAGRVAAGGTLTTAYNTLPLDMARIVLDSHEGADDIIWADWRYAPLLRTIQILERRAPTARIEFDSTSESPAELFEAGKTYTMRASKELAKLHPLVMTNLHWKIVDAPLTSESGDSPIFSFAGLDVLSIDSASSAIPGQPLNVRVTFCRGENTAETVTGSLILTRNGRPRLSTPFSLLHWHYAPKDLEPNVAYFEPLQTIIPAAHADDESRFSLRIRLESADEAVDYELGPVIISAQRP